MGGAVWIMVPFLPATLWATTIVIATWPALRKLGFIVPMTVAIGALIRNRESILAGVASLRSFTMPPAPEWLAGIPLIGTKAAEGWDALAASPGELPAKVQPYARRLRSGSLEASAVWLGCCCNSC
jgi:hypothetical protein